MYVYGRNSVDEALSDGLDIRSVYVDKTKRFKFEKLIDRLWENGVKVEYAPETFLEKEARTRKHQGIIADIILPSNIVERIEEPIDWAQYDTIVALDGITDTGNLGAIIRSALLLGADAIVMPNDNSARITPATIKASAGAVYRQNLYYVNSLNTFIQEAQSQDFKIYALMGREGEPITEIEFAEKRCIVIGSEREGIRKSVRKLSDYRVEITTTRQLDSLNASVASAIAMWEIFRRKKG